MFHNPQTNEGIDHKHIEMKENNTFTKCNTRSHIKRDIKRNVCLS